MKNHGDYILVDFHIGDNDWIEFIAWVLRFINNCKQENKLSQVELSVEEISDAESYIIKEMRKKEFKEELYITCELPTHS